MKPNALYAQLELIPADYDQPDHSNDRSVNPVWDAAKQRLGQAGRSLLTSLCGSREPRISVGRDRQGQPLFIAYDPVDQVRHTFHTEQDLRIWLDQRYYQS
ncbi:hypothetical protein [Leptolyngbya sp. PCC 6406]|uniref:hypothetical protein n=1 Tax=Leptolyngbya sp. PCC 6406 TaxID=1173264 RepID=UPI0002ABA1AC|nr:hypothetical protein [Leptolyngbya sp. PCC 6406]